ncbi:MAG: hypothetical protein FVQ79_00285 [Planctomycetes bacterium]|nr:hypothetical protein [Planctomycetota bacterium]
MSVVKEPDWTKGTKGVPSKAIRYKENLNGCWVCTSHPPEKNHGHPTIRRTKVWNSPRLLARYIYLILRGSIPKGLQVNHSCSNSLCINPAHLYLGTQVENIEDTRNTNKEFGGPKTSPLTILKVKNLLKNTDLTQIMIARRLRIGPCIVSNIKLGRL